MIRGSICTIMFLLATIAIFASQEAALSLKDVRGIMEKIFSYHVENKEFSPLLVKRSFKLYIEQFDPEKIYLMQDEVEPFLNLDLSVLAEVVRDYYHDQFPQYSRLSQVIQKAIYRQQKSREKQTDLLINKGIEAVNRNVPLSYTDYPSTMQEMEERVLNHLLLPIKRGTKTTSQMKVNTMFETWFVARRRQLFCW